MRSGVPFDVLREEFSVSVVYGAFPEFEPEMRGSYKRIWEDLKELDSKVESRRAELRVLESNVMGRQGEVEELSGRKGSLEGEVHQLEERLRELDASVVDRERRLEECRRLGLTEVALRRLDGMDFGSGDELIGRLDTLESYRALKLETEELSGDVDMMRIEAAGLQAERASLDGDISDLRNRRDEEKRNNWVLEESIGVVMEFLAKGYDSKTILGVAKGLKTFEIKGQPKASVRRLLDALGGVEELGELEASIRERRAELSNVAESIAQARGALTGIRDTTLKAVADAESEAKALIRMFYDDTAERLGKLEDAGEQAIRDLYEEERKWLNETILNSHALLMKYITDSRELIGNTAGKLTNTMAGLRGELGALGAIADHLGRYPVRIDAAVRLLNLVNDLEESEKIPISFIAQAANCIAFWTSKMQPEAKTSPSPTVNRFEPQFNTNNSYLLVAIALWMAEELSRRATLGSFPMNRLAGTF